MVHPKLFHHHKWIQPILF